MAKKNTHTNAGKNADTPLMKQYAAIKAKHPEAILLFRVGDFYETFGEDAIKTAKILGIVLTKRHNGSAGEVELAGFPYHALDNYLPKLVKAGQRVAICEQLEDPKMAKKIVKRGVTELVSPGVAFTDQILENKSNNFLASVVFDRKSAGIALLDVSTGEFLTASGSLDYLKHLLSVYQPKEILLCKDIKQQWYQLFGDQYYCYFQDEWIYTHDYTYDLLTKHFETASLKGFGIEEDTLMIMAAGSALHYVKMMQQNSLKHISQLQIIPHSEYVWLDDFTIRNLELVQSNFNNGPSLFSVMDNTLTPMGSRLLKKRILLPLKDVKRINQRLNQVAFFYNNIDMLNQIRQMLSRIADIERITSKVAVQKANPRDLLILANSLNIIPEIIQLIQDNQPDESIQSLLKQIIPLDDVAGKILQTIDEDAPAVTNKPGIIAKGVNAGLDELRELLSNSHQKLSELQQNEIKRTGIPNLKISFNNVFGYYIEVRNTHKDKVPADWERKQTLTQAERYITPELKEWEAKILGAEEKILLLEQEIYQQLVEYLQNYTSAILNNAQIIARLDVAQSTAWLALDKKYVKPEVNDGYEIYIKDGRHPVIEQFIEHPYIPNDTCLDNKQQQILIITGPNMSGKSAYLRQNALIVLMAQMGCYVPASMAKIGVIDKLFTRVGASDNLAKGESTFMVEMIETAGILNNVTQRSLVILDEIGRGTSTFDGISIARAIAEYLHNTPGKQAKTLFATHYHELNELEKSFERIKNYSIAIKEENAKVIFLHKIKPGGSEHSFGIHVAKMAGIPAAVVRRANEILNELEQKHAGKDRSGVETSGNFQLSIFQLNDPVLEDIKEELMKIDINTLTPVEALLILNNIKNKVGIKN
ncbi:MAG: DNA mismatch repair protein MutS [Vicingaceae bacterium]|nr:MAG: DNA mismatch repair protein MutS [Vicingaceae bacterium]